MVNKVKGKVIQKEHKENSLFINQILEPSLLSINQGSWGRLTCLQEMCHHPAKIIGRSYHLETSLAESKDLDLDQSERQLLIRQNPIDQVLVESLKQRKVSRRVCQEFNDPGLRLGLTLRELRCSNNMSSKIRSRILINSGF